MLLGPDGAARRWSFAQEVRRTAPFVPALAGRVRRPVTLDGVVLHEGDRIVLDVVGIDHDPAYHPLPEVFDPERWLGRQPDAWTLVPQGGGPITGHRCPGEDLTLQLLATTLEVLAEHHLSPTAPLQVDLARIPTLPVDGLPLRLGAQGTNDARTHPSDSSSDIS
nr:cytochrome P450 [Nocardioides flavescens]